MAVDPTESLFAAARAWVAAHYPGRVARRVSIALDGGERVRLPVPPAPAPALGQAPPDAPFVPTALQDAILDALAGRALRTDALAVKVNCDRSQIFRKGGLKELREQGLIANHPRVGFYRPDDPPPELGGEVSPHAGH